MATVVFSVPVMVLVPDDAAIDLEDEAIIESADYRLKNDFDDSCDVTILKPQRLSPPTVELDDTYLPPGRWAA
jgi:hypothetical protein